MSEISNFLPTDREDNGQASTSSPKYNLNDMVELQVNFNNKIYEIKMAPSSTVSKYIFSHKVLLFLESILHWRRVEV